METTFAVRGPVLRSSILCTAGFTAMAVASVLLAFFGRDSIGNPLAFASLMLSFWGGWTLFGIYSIACCLRERLSFSPDGVTKRGVFHERRMPIANIKCINWNYARKVINLLGNDGRVTIELKSFEPHEQLSIIRFLHTFVPESVQHDWPSFCHVAAMRLLEGDPDPDKDPRYVRHTRRRWDRLFAVSIGAIAIVLIPTAWWLSQPVMLVAPVGLLPLWFILRFSTSAKGNASKRMRAIKVDRFLYFCGIWLLIGLVGTSLTWPSAPALAIDEIPWRLWLFLSAWLGVLFWQAHVGEKRQLRNLLEGSQESVERWNKLGDNAPDANS